MDALEIASGLDAITRLRPLWMDAESRAQVGAFEKFELVVAAAELAERQGSEPLVAVVRRDCSTSLMLPLRRERLLGARTAVPLVHPLSQYTDVVGGALEADELIRICNALRRRGIDLILLRKVRQDGGLHMALARHGTSQSARETSHYIDLAGYGAFAAYEASFSSRTRRNRRQRLQRFEAQAGPLSFEVLRGAEAATAFDTAVRWKRDWLTQRGVSSPVFNGGEWERILRGAVLAGSTIVTALKAGQALIGVEMGFANRSDYMAYLGAYDETYSSLSPGQEQMLRTIAWCFEQGFRRYDLLAPSDDYKRHWTRANTGVEIDDYALALTRVGRGVAEVRRRVRPLARDFYHWLTPEMRVAGGRYGVPAAAAVAAATASALISSIE
ncbi:GNAT family N-acetyltransferase [Hyphomicrobium sp. CS1GBMeth3]|uniref:GNAT family N-acetyltransferase n=1 Tax=Hyphomicrobium sp. CS1GBMeth3 TaxID=1892845 RepID=UPI000930499D|nr:GNAT family N-acetyltransferase [Hyphomicrobium sp. CS1GBMeth3]